MARLLPLLTLLGAVAMSVGTAVPKSDASPLANDVSSKSASDTKDTGNWVDSKAAVFADSTNSDWDDDGSDDRFSDDDDVGNHITFPIDDLDDEGLHLYMNLEDDMFLAGADEHVAKKLLLEYKSLKTKGTGQVRRKRIAPLIGRAAFAVGRALFRSFSRGGITRSGSRLTRHYNGRGNYNTAVRDFNRLRPDNVRTFNNGRISGRTGTMGNHRVTVRDGSSGNSRPTLEIRSHGGDMVRKFRYND